MGLEADQKSVLLLDCWSVHKSKDFREFMAAEFPNILIFSCRRGARARASPSTRPSAVR